jgi:hypothetical protein
MPIVHRTDHEHRIVIALAYGVLTDEDVFAFQHSVWSGTDVVGYNELGDMTNVTDVSIASIHRVRDLAMTAADMDVSDATSKFAIVAPEDLGFGLARMFQAYREMEKASKKEVGVFRTLEKAFAWLGIDKPLPLPELPRGARKR